jgi:hypothetical protein
MSDVRILALIPGAGWWLTIQDGDDVTRERVVVFALVERPDGLQRAWTVEALVPNLEQPARLELAFGAMDFTGLVHEGDAWCRCGRGNDEGGSPRSHRSDPGWCVRCGGTRGERRRPELPEL